MTAGALTGINVTAGGQGYKVPPAVTITPYPGDTGSGAQATATVANGSVTGFAITAPGSGYLMPPTVALAGGAGDDTNVKRVFDEDIEGGILDATFNINPGIFQNQTLYSRAFLYLAAHQMIEKLKMAAAGVQSGYSWLTASKSVEGAASSYKFPDQILENPFLAHISTTRYGAMYLQIISPLLVGNIQADCTFTNP